MITSLTLSVELRPKFELFLRDPQPGSYRKWVFDNVTSGSKNFNQKKSMLFKVSIFSGIFRIADFSNL